MSLLSRFWDQSFFIPKPALTENNLPDQSGRVFIVTGGYVGVGRELARILYGRNGAVYLAGRNKDKADAAISDIKSSHPNSEGRLEFLQLDLQDLPTIKPAVEEFLKKERRLDVLTNNAGISGPPPGSKSAQNHELQIATNCLGPFLFTKLLTPLLQSTAALPDTTAGSVRVTWAGSIAVDLLSPTGGVTINDQGVFVSEGSKEKDYGASKAGNALLAAEFARRNGSSIISNAWNPGNLRTELQRHFSWIEDLLISWLLYPAVFGAYTELFAGWSEEAGKADKNGVYVIPWGRFGRFREDVHAEIAKEGGKAAKFWDWCDRETAKFC